jgi:alpha-tubulin suppressor-like RCC1 family protein
LGEKYLQEEPRKVLKSKNFNKVSIGDSCTFALTYDGDLYGMGTGVVNLDGNHGAEHKEPIPVVVGQKVKSVSAGGKHAAYINTSGEVFTWGSGGSWFSGGGQLGHGNTSDQNKPKYVHHLPLSF